MDDLDIALNESQVCGLRHEADEAEVQVLVEVLALPALGPIDSDPRRVLTLSGVSSVELRLRTDGLDGLGPVLPLATLDELEDFFASLQFAEPMYGWSFLDVDAPGESWSSPASLTWETSRPDVETHTLHWFTECGREEPGGTWLRFLLQGVVRFEDLRIERADGRVLPHEEFIADALRWWLAFHQGDERLPGDAQRRAQATAVGWRSWAGTSVMVPGMPTTDSP